MSEVMITVKSAAQAEAMAPASSLILPPRKRLEIMDIAIRTACDIMDNARYEDNKEDATVVVAAILSAVDALSRRNVAA